MAWADSSRAPEVSGEAAPQRNAAGTLADAVRVVNALGSAYATFQLFQAPEEQPAFLSAIEVIADAPSIGTLEVASDHFIWGRNPVASTHSGATRLAARIFAHGIAAIRFFTHPSAAEVRTVFDIVRRQPGDESLAGGVGRAVSQLGVASIRLMDRAPLTESDVEEEDDDTSTTLGSATTFDPADYLGNPESFAQRILDEAEHDEGALVALVADRYAEAMSLVEDADVWGREELVHTFVDAFFYFPRSFQGPLLAELLARGDAPEFQTFLDQFAHHELQELAPYLDSGSHPLLIDYAKLAMDDENPPLDELHALLQDTAPKRPPDESITSRVGRVLRPSLTGGAPPARQAIYRLQRQVGAPAGESIIAAEVMRGLLELANTSPDTNRRLRIWARRLFRIIQSGRVDEILEWAGMVIDNADLGFEAADVGDAISKTARADDVAALVGVVHDHDCGSEPALQNLYAHLTTPIIEVLGAERDAGRRRILLGMLTHAARVDATPILSALDDSRWYVVRNLVLVLGHSNHPEAVEHIRGLASHPDPRVRREVIRALHALEGDADLDLFLAAMEDDDRSVRTAAATVVRACHSPLELPALIGILEGGAPPEVKADAVAMLASHESSEATKALERLATRRLFPTRGARALRSAARQAREGRP
ncbi:MAG: HEAT repeat domain-containing protein [Actinomycetota bacterium]|nr:HEAT repeat domain-containing protein [Actinomycetota bacterium]